MLISNFYVAKICNRILTCIEIEIDCFKKALTHNFSMAEFCSICLAIGLRGLRKEKSSLAGELTDSVIQMLINRPVI